MLRLIVLVFILSVICCRFLSEFLIWAGASYGFMDSEGRIGHLKKIRSVPNIGGVGIFLSIFIVSFLIINSVSCIAWGSLGIDSPRSVFFITLFLSTFLVHIVGMIDDRRGLSPIPKFVVQFVSASSVVWFLDLELLKIVDSMFGFGGIMSKALAIFWIVGITNGINYLDNIDGLVSGIVFVAALVLAFFAYQAEQSILLVFLTSIMGVSFAFILVNRFPARIFMGDGGSLVFGFLLGVLSLSVIYWDGEAYDQEVTGWHLVFSPIIIFSIVIYDIFVVSFIRWKQGKNLFIGDQQHLTHRLFAKGLSHWQVVMLIWSFSLILAVLAFFVTKVGHFYWVMLLLFVAIIFALWWFEKKEIAKCLIKK